MVCDALLLLACIEFSYDRSVDRLSVRACVRVHLCLAGIFNRGSLGTQAETKEIRSGPARQIGPRGAEPSGGDQNWKGGKSVQSGVSVGSYSGTRRLLVYHTCLSSIFLGPSEAQVSLR